MAIDHVVVLAHLVDVDGRQLVALCHLPIDAGPAVAQPAADRKEGRVEVGGFRLGGSGADDTIDGDLLLSAVGATLLPRSLQHILH